MLGLSYHNILKCRIKHHGYGYKLTLYIHLLWLWCQFCERPYQLPSTPHTNLYAPPHTPHICLLNLTMSVGMDRDS